MPQYLSDNTRGVPLEWHGLTIYELLRSIVRSLHWTRENELDALGLIDRMEEVGMFGSMGDTIKSD